MKTIDPKHERTQRLLRRIGIPLMVLGGVLTLIGLGSFFAAFGGMQPPRLFWCTFLGLPIGLAGLVLTSYSFLGAIARYSAGEMAPVGKDTFNYLAEGTQEAVRTVASAVGEGLSFRQPTDKAGGSVRCLKCNQINDAEAKFCDNCGFALQKTKSCPSCREMNDPDARYCDNCGRSLTG